MCFSQDTIDKIKTNGAKSMVFTHSMMHQMFHNNSKRKLFRNYSLQRDASIEFKLLHNFDKILVVGDYEKEAAS